jgi:hypothetical protein
VSEVYEKIRETCMSRAHFKLRCSFFADSPNIAGDCRVIWKFIMEGRFLPSSLSAVKVYNTKVSVNGIFYLCVATRQLLYSNTRNRLCRAVLGISQDGVRTDSYENFSMKSWKRDQSNDTKFYPPLFSLVNTHKKGRKSNFNARKIKLKVDLKERQAF